MWRVDGWKDNALTRGGLPDKPGRAGNPCRALCRLQEAFPLLVGEWTHEFEIANLYKKACRLY
ncbi:hypothetical protein KKC1_03610 [Calderihabitans maritimus]|uniref:Uncharacterized protein n=1 Tax=Calderihabitans maritimus TaxID=1246530 RepID=A0A1Z5HNT6_9FIRM|nr:hypothetical protein KKC1_03610 [Calderihabitans maritimus]